MCVQQKGGAKKIKIKSINLPVISHVPQMNKTKLNELFEKEVGY